MAAIDFPNSPTLNQEFTSGDRTWIWDGTVWNSKPTAAPLDLGDLNDVNAPSPVVDDLLTWDGTDWINVSYADAGISAVGHSHAQSDITGLTSDLAAKATTGKAIAMAIVFG